MPQIADQRAQVCLTCCVEKRAESVVLVIFNKLSADVWGIHS